MTDRYEVVSSGRLGDLPQCDRCGFEDAELETIEGTRTIERGNGAADIERLCRYCHESELGGYTAHADVRTTITPHMLARGIVHAFNALESALRFEIQSNVVALARAMHEDTAGVGSQPYGPNKRKRSKDRRQRAILGGKFGGVNDRRKQQRREER